MYLYKIYIYKIFYTNYIKPKFIDIAWQWTFFSAKKTSNVKWQHHYFARVEDLWLHLAPSLLYVALPAVVQVELTVPLLHVYSKINQITND